MDMRTVREVALCDGLEGEIVLGFFGNDSSFWESDFVVLEIGTTCELVLK